MPIVLIVQAPEGYSFANRNVQAAADYVPVIFRLSQVVSPAVEILENRTNFKGIDGRMGIKKL